MTFLTQIEARKIRKNGFCQPIFPTFVQKCTDETRSQAQPAPPAVTHVANILLYRRFKAKSQPKISQILCLSKQPKKRSIHKKPLNIDALNLKFAQIFVVTTVSSELHTIKVHAKENLLMKRRMCHQHRRQSTRQRNSKILTTPKL